MNHTHRKHPSPKNRNPDRDARLAELLQAAITEADVIRANQSPEAAFLHLRGQVSSILHKSVIRYGVTAHAKGGAKP